MKKKFLTSWLRIHLLKDLVITIPKQVCIIPTKEFQKVEEFISIILGLTPRNPTRHYVVNNVNIPWVKVNYKQLLIRKAFKNIGLKFSTANILDK